MRALRVQLEVQLIAVRLAAPFGGDLSGSALLKLDALRLASNCGKDNDRQERARREDGEGHREVRSFHAPQTLGDDGLDRHNPCREEVAKLVRKAGEGSAHSVRREFVEMHGNNTPGTLYHEL